MTKTPEQMAEEYANESGWLHGDYVWREAHGGFLAGYQAAKDEDQAKVQELEANWKFCCEDKARLLNELAAAERAKDQLADADKVVTNMEAFAEVLYADMPVAKEAFLRGYKQTKAKLNTIQPQWISVKERLPEEDVKVWALINYVLEGKTIREVVEASLKNWLWSGDRVHITHPLVSHWMPLPEPPKEEK